MMIFQQTIRNEPQDYKTNSYFATWTHFTLSIKAMSPEAIAAAAELAPKLSVHPLFLSAVT